MSARGNYAPRITAIPTRLPDGSMSVDLPIKTVGGLNAREHWQARAHRVRRERTTASNALRGWLEMPAFPLVVTMTRLSFGELDDDNLQGAFKAIRDGVADALGIDDRDPRVSWRYSQERCKRGEYSVRIRIEPRVDLAAAA